MKLAATRLALFGGALILATGCSGSRTASPVIAPEVQATDGQVSAPEVVREPDPSPRERWLSPFAVTAIGTVRPIEPRTVIVIAADPEIAAGLAEQRAIALSIRERDVQNAPADSVLIEKPDSRGTPGPDR